MPGRAAGDAGAGGKGGGLMGRRCRVRNLRRRGNDADLAARVSGRVAQIGDAGRTAQRWRPPLDPRPRIRAALPHHPCPPLRPHFPPQQAGRNCHKPSTGKCTQPSPATHSPRRRTDRSDCLPPIAGRAVTGDGRTVPCLAQCMVQSCRSTRGEALGAAERGWGGCCVLFFFCAALVFHFFVLSSLFTPPPLASPLLQPRPPPGLSQPDQTDWAGALGARCRAAAQR